MKLDQILNEEIHNCRNKIITDSEDLEDYLFDEEKRSCSNLINSTVEIFRDYYILYNHQNLENCIITELMDKLIKRTEILNNDITEDMLQILKIVNKKVDEIIHESSLDKESKKEEIKKAINEYNYNLEDIKNKKPNFHDQYSDINNIITNKYKVFESGDAKHYFDGLINTKEKDIEENFKDQINILIKKSSEKINGLADCLINELSKEEEIIQSNEVVEKSSDVLIGIVKDSVNMNSKFNYSDVSNKTENIIQSNFENIFNGLDLSEEVISKITKKLNNKLSEECSGFNLEISEKQFNSDGSIIDVLATAFNSNEPMPEDDYSQVKNVYSESENSIENYPSLKECYDDFKDEIKIDYNVDLESEKYSELEDSLQGKIKNTEIDLKNVINNNAIVDKTEILKLLDGTYYTYKDILNSNSELDSNQVAMLFDYNKSKVVETPKKEYVSAFK